jgi:uncharacterized protein
LTFLEKYGDWAVVAGAAEGLGKAWSESLAKRKMNIVMVDNQPDLLDQLAKKLEKEDQIQIIRLHLDLGKPDAYKDIIDNIQNINCRLLVYNAAYSLVKPFMKVTTAELDNFIGINTRTQIKLVHSFADYLIGKKNGGGILLMSSLAGLIGMHMVTAYAATKAFSWNLAEALHYELKPHQIDVMGCIAGATATPAYLKTNPKYGFIKPLVMKPEAVTEAALNKLGKKTLFIPGFSNRLNYFILTHLLPRKMAANIANSTMGNMYKHLK